MSFEFRCTTCDQIHTGMPTFGAAAPVSYYEIPTADREKRCYIGKNDCVIDGKWFFVRGCIEIPVHGQDDDFVWGVWVSLSEENYWIWNDSLADRKRSHLGPFFGWLNAWLRPYPDTLNLKTMVHLRDRGTRPYVELEKTDHPLFREQQNGISVQRVAEIYSVMMHENVA